MLESKTQKGEDFDLQSILKNSSSHPLINVILFLLSIIINCRTPIAISTIAMLNSARKAVEQARRVSQNFTAAAGKDSTFNSALNFPFTW